MKEEFTTEMHQELLGSEERYVNIRIMGVYGAIQRGRPKREALLKYKMDEKFYDRNIKKVLFT